MVALALSSCLALASIFSLSQLLCMSKLKSQMCVWRGVGRVRRSGLRPVLLEKCWATGRLNESIVLFQEDARRCQVFICTLLLASCALAASARPQRLGPLHSILILGKKVKSLFPNHCPPAPLCNNCPIKWVLERSKNPDPHQWEPPE